VLILVPGSGALNGLNWAIAAVAATAFFSAAVAIARASTSAAAVMARNPSSPTAITTSWLALRPSSLSFSITRVARGVTITAPAVITFVRLNAGASTTAASAPSAPWLRRNLTGLSSAISATSWVSGRRS
jgi:hypothetical protein